MQPGPELLIFVYGCCSIQLRSDGVQISALVCKNVFSCHQSCMQKLGRNAV